LSFAAKGRKKGGAKALKPLDLSGVRTYPLARRKSKVAADQTARPHRRGASFAAFWESLPRSLAAEALRALIADILRARARGKPILWGIGAHVIKVGLTPILIDLMKRDLVTGLAMNGACLVHDFELAVAGKTSEDVAASLGGGRFGMARETGAEINHAVSAGICDGLGLGAALGRHLARRRPAPAHDSLLAAAWRLEIPATVHVAIGTDVVHLHPACDPAAVGEGSHMDFRLFAGQVARLGGGGVYLNVGSAVILPEVFLKAVSLARNLGHSLRGFSTANLDFIQHYRPTVNVVERPTRGVGRGYALIGHHELLVPLLAAALVESD
jgi:hypothetical protein